LRENNEATRGAIGKKRIRGANRKEALEKLKGPEGAERGERNRKELDAGGLVVPLMVREKRDVPPTKMPEGVKR
jgi:dephospho-CoA kinase